MQHDLNMLEVGPVFDSTTHTAQLLTLLFFAMTFAPGLPLLMPLCCFAFILYFRIDKYLLCRFYQKPPHYGDAAIRIVISQLPWAAVLRLAIGCWMLGNNNILPVETNPYPSTASSSDDDAVEGDNGGVAGHITRSNTLPLLVFMLILICVKATLKFFEFVPLYAVLKCCFLVFREMESHRNAAKIQQASINMNEDMMSIHPWELVKSGDLRRQQIAPFTGDYLRLIKHKDEIPDTCMQMCSYAYLTNVDEAEIEDGWEVRHQGDFVIKVKTWTNVRKKSKHKRGDLKKTHEVIADHRCATYNIEKIPTYVVPMQGLREGTMSLMEYQIRDQRDRNAVDAMLYNAFDAGNLESNVIANYNKRKTGHGDELDAEAAQKAAAKHKAMKEKIQEEEEEDELDYSIENNAKIKPTLQTKGGRSGGVAVENLSDSFYMTDGLTPTPHGAPKQPFSYGGVSSKSNHSAPRGGATVGNISMTTASRSKSKDASSDLPAYLAMPPDEEMGEQEQHVPYFPKSRSAASGDAGDNSGGGGGGHKPYFPPARSSDSGGDSSGHKKKKDKKHKHKKREVELAPLQTSSAAAYGQSAPDSSYSAGHNAYSYDSSYYEDDPYGDAYAEVPYEGADFDDGGGVSGLV